MYLTFLTLIIGRKFNVLETNCCFKKKHQKFRAFYQKVPAETNYSHENQKQLTKVSSTIKKF